MNQPQEQIRSITVKEREPSIIQMISAKKSNIPTPIESEDKSTEVIKWGKRNEYPYYLNYLAESNPIHSDIIRAKKRFTVSGGLIYEGSDQEGFDKFFKNKKDSHNDKNIEDLISSISMNYEISNMFCFRVLFNFVGEKKYKKLEIIPFEKIRFEFIYNENNDVVLTGNIRVCEDWLDGSDEVEILNPYDPFDDEQRECFVIHQEESGQTIVGPKGKKVNPGFYPSPLYSGAITDIDTLIQIGIYNNSEIHNGFSLGTMIYLANGKPKNEKDKKDLEADLTASTTGGLQAGRSMVIYGNGQDQKPEIFSLQGNNLPDRYTNTKKGSEDSIVQAHQVVVPTLFGVKQEGSFNASELETGYAIMEANYFTDRRNAILSVLNFIFNEIAGIDGKIGFGKVILNLENQIDVDDSNRAAKALNEMSPLVATKVLSSMTPNEIRNLAKLAPVDGGDDLPEPKEATFSKEQSDEILERFKKHGQKRDNFEVVFSKSLIDGSKDEENEFLEIFKKEAFQSLPDNEQRALELIQQNQGFNQIRKTLDVSSTELGEIYQSLIAKGLINSDGTLTTEGKKQIAVNDVESLTIMYEYRLRPNAPELVEGGKSREFCEVLIGLNRLYTRADIEMISGVEGYNVFNYRGGWYHNPNTGKNEPGCRHEWSQVVTFNK